MAHGEGAPDSGMGKVPDATGGQASDAPATWGNNGLVGDGRYRLTRRLGRGGMAEVFAAEDIRLGRTVAVKLLRSDLAEDPVSEARFTREAQSVAGLNHHAVVAVYDSGEDLVGGKVVPYMVMELVHGRTIRDLLINADAPPAHQALVIVSGVLEALAYSHQHGIVHRDIKPANVIITDTGSIKVMDFGIARALHGAAQTMTQTGMVMGTPQYLSPEQALGKTVDTRSDLYAVGCLLYELLALRPPFVGETPLSVVYQHVQDTPVPPSTRSATTPPELDGLVMRALTKDPDDRFQSAEEMRGVVQYALRMLEQHGSHTNGLWNTGPVSPGATPPMGTPVGTPVQRAASEAATSQLSAPLLLGDQAGGGNHNRHRSDRPSEGRHHRRRAALLVLLALLTVAAGLLIALSLNRGGQEPSPGPVGPAPEEREKQQPNPTPDNEDEKPAQEPEIPAQPEAPVPDEPEPPAPEPTPTPTENPTPEEPGELPDEPPPDTGGTTEGDSTEGSTEGTTDGTTTEGTEGTTTGTTSGSTEGDSTGTTSGSTEGDSTGTTGSTSEGSSTEGSGEVGGLR